MCFATIKREGAGDVGDFAYHNGVRLTQTTIMDFELTPHRADWLTENWWFIYVVYLMFINAMCSIINFLGRKYKDEDSEKEDARIKQIGEVR